MIKLSTVSTVCSGSKFFAVGVVQLATSSNHPHCFGVLVVYECTRYIFICNWCRDLGNITTLWKAGVVCNEVVVENKVFRESWHWHCSFAILMGLVCLYSNVACCWTRMIPKSCCMINKFIEHKHSHNPHSQPIIPDRHNISKHHFTHQHQIRVLQQSHDMHVYAVGYEWENSPVVSFISCFVNQ